METQINQIRRFFSNPLNTTFDHNSEYSDHLSKPILYAYIAFVDIAVRRSSSPYKALDIKRDSSKLEQHFNLYVGFIHCEFDWLTARSIYNYCVVVKKALKGLYLNSETLLECIELSPTSIGNDVLACVSLYKSFATNSALLKYYSGWSCQSKDGKELFLHLANFADKFGYEYASEVHITINNYVKTQKSTTATNSIFRFTRLLNTFADLCENFKELKDALRAENSTKLMLDSYHLQLSRTVKNGKSVEAFINDWKYHHIPKFTSCFVETGFIEEPITPFIAPKFRSPTNRLPIFSTGGRFTAKEEE